MIVVLVGMFFILLYMGNFSRKHFMVLLKYKAGAGYCFCRGCGSLTTLLWIDRKK